MSPTEIASSGKREKEAEERKVIKARKLGSQKAGKQGRKLSKLEVRRQMIDFDRQVLSDEQKAALERLLALQGGADDGMTLPELEGLLYGVALNPGMVMPSKWLPEIINEDFVRFETNKQAEELLPPLLEAYNSYNDEVNAGLLHFPFNLLEVDEENYEDLLDWCWGLKKGIFIDTDAWNIGDIAMPEDGAEMGDSPAFALCLIEAINDPKIRNGLFTAPDGSMVENEEQSLAIALARLPGALKILQEYAGGLRQKYREELTRSPRGNEFCPCGSGRKYKKCCGKRK